MKPLEALRANLLLIGAAIAAVLVVALAFYERDRVTRANCQQIETLKAQFRIQAEENYRNLPRTARLLGVELTPELREQARRNRDLALSRFAEREC